MKALPPGKFDVLIGSPVAGSVGIAITRAPSKLPTRPCSATIAVFWNGAGQVLGAKSSPNGVLPMTKPTVSSVTPLQSGVGPEISGYGTPFVAQHGNPQSSFMPSRTGTSFSLPPSSPEPS